MFFDLVPKNIKRKLDMEENKTKKEREKLEKDVLVQKILAYKRQGLNDYAISKMPDIPIKNSVTITKKVKKCIDFGMITQKEIKEAGQEKERRELLEDEKIQKILNYKRQGLNDYAVSKMPDIQINSTTVTSKIQKCIDFGIITLEEIEEAELEKERRELIENEQISKILKYREQGLSGKKISEMPDIIWSQSVIQKKINRCVELGIFTEEKPEEKNQKIIQYRKQGLSYQAIAKMPDIALSKSTIKKRVLKFIELGLITKDEVKEGKKEKEQKSFVENEDIQRILEYRKRGLSYKKISEMPDVNLSSQGTVKEKIEKGIELGLITEQQYKEARRAEEENQMLKNSEIQRVLEYRKQGLCYMDITRMPDISLSRDLVKKTIDRGIELGLITKQQYEEAKKNRERWEMMKNKELQRILAYRKKGLSYKAISKKPDIDKSDTTVKEYIQKEIKEGIFSEESTEKNEQLPSNKEENSEEDIKTLNRLKRQIEVSVRLENLPTNVTDEEKQKIRKYIDLCYKIHEKQRITKIELLFLKQALQKVPIDEKDIIRFVRQGIVIGEYTEALNFVRNRHGRKEVTISKEREEALEELESSLIKASKIQKAIQIIRRGNTNTEVISGIAGLSKDEVNILKIQLSGKPVKLLNMSKRKKVVELLLQNKKANVIQKELEMSDFEMQDIKDEVKFKRIGLKESTSAVVRVRQNTRIRIVVLATKLGMKIDRIAKVLKMEPEEVEKDIEEALKVDLIKLNEVQGIKMLNAQELKFKALEL